MENQFEYYIENKDLHLKYAKCEPAVKEQEFHDYYEFVFFINGEASFISRNIQQELTPKSIIIIPREHFHQFLVKKPQNYERCILGFKATPETATLIAEVMDDIKVISEPDSYLISVFEHLTEIIQSKLTDTEKILYINSAIVQLIIYLKYNSSLAIRKNIKLSAIIVKTLSLIDEKYAEPLSVKSISEALYVSPSTLAHKFRKEMNISVYQYITKKRLAVVHKLIEQGESFSTASLKSGFSDYSCFYRLYKKYYKQ